jgi:predicted nucleic acid-binding Zn ribbon protein
LSEGKYQSPTSNDCNSSFSIIRELSEDRKVTFEFCDDPLKLSSKKWERVVAVFVNNSEWYFRDWFTLDKMKTIAKLGENKRMIELLLRIKAYYLLYND